MLKNTHTIEILGNEKRVYYFHFNPNAPLGEVYDVLGRMKDYVLKHMEIQEKIKRKNEDQELQKESQR